MVAILPGSPPQPGPDAASRLPEVLPLAPHVAVCLSLARCATRGPDHRGWGLCVHPPAAAPSSGLPETRPGVHSGDSSQERRPVFTSRPGQQQLSGGS